MYEMGRTYLEFVRQLHLQKSIIGVVENDLYLIMHLHAHAIMSVSGSWSALLLTPRHLYSHCTCPSLRPGHLHRPVRGSPQSRRAAPASGGHGQPARAGHESRLDARRPPSVGPLRRRYNFSILMYCILY